MEKELLTKMIGGNIGGENLITTTIYKYNEQTFKYLGCSQLFDGGERAKKEGYYTFDSVKAFIESHGEIPLKLIEDNKLS